LEEKAHIDLEKNYIHFKGKVLVARAQYLLSAAELDNGCLVITNWTQQEK
jgi:hypothetical protein